MKLGRLGCEKMESIIRKIATIKIIQYLKIQKN
jgi:hypothetical protein